MSNRLPNKATPAFQFDEDDEDEVRKAKSLINKVGLEKLATKARQRGSKSRGLRFTDKEYGDLKDGMKETRSGSVPKYILMLHEERKIWQDMRRILKGIDRRMTDLELHVREELRKFRSDFEVTEKMLAYFIRAVHEHTFLAQPRVVVGIPSGVTEVEKRAVHDAALNAGARTCYLIEEPMAAAIGAGLPVMDENVGLAVCVVSYQRAGGGTEGDKTAVGRDVR